MKRSYVALAAIIALAAVQPDAMAQGAAKPAASQAKIPAGWPQTRAERSNYKETSTYQDVVDFVDSLQARAGDRVWVGSMGRTIEGRDLPYVVASRPLVTTPAEAKRLRRPVVYVQGNIHSGEVEGKEALQSYLRDVIAKTGPSILDSVVFIAVPIYNADGNEKFQPQARARSAQNGPEMVGTRPNASGLNLNRDYIKAETPETRASLALFTAWDPDIYVDLHTSDGSPHGYALTYSPSLNPAGDLAYATFGASYARDSLLPTIRRRMLARHNYAVFDYGNFGSDGPGRGAGPGGPPGGANAGGPPGAGGRGAGGRGGDSTGRGGAAGGAGGRGAPGGRAGGGGGGGGMVDTLPQAWRTYEHTPRYGSNYYALRGRIGLLSEAFSHDPFERRIKSTYAFVEEILAIAAEKRVSILALSERSDRNLASGKLTDVPIRSRMTTKPFKFPLAHEVFLRMGDTVQYEPGLGRGVKRTGRVKTTTLNVYDRFEPTMSVKAPVAYLIPAIGTDSTISVLRAHGVVVERLRAPWSGPGETFTIDSLVKARAPFEGHSEVRLEGHWRTGTVEAPAGYYVVRTTQPLGVLAVVLLEPQSDDGVTTWNFVDHLMSVGSDHPILRARAAVTAPAWILP